MRVLTNHGQSTSTLSSLFFYLLLYFIEFMRFNNFLYSKILCVNKILMVRLKNSNIKITHKHKIILANIYIYIYPHTLSTHFSFANVVLVRRVSASARAPSGPMLLL